MTSEYNRLKVNKVSQHKNTLKDWNNELRVVWLESDDPDIKQKEDLWRYEN